MDKLSWNLHKVHQHPNFLAQHISQCIQLDFHSSPIYETGFGLTIIYIRLEKSFTFNFSLIVNLYQNSFFSLLYFTTFRLRSFNLSRQTLNFEWPNFNFHIITTKYNFQLSSQYSTIEFNRTHEMETIKK